MQLHVYRNFFSVLYVSKATGMQIIYRIKDQLQSNISNFNSALKCIEEWANTWQLQLSVKNFLYFLD